MDKRTKRNKTGRENGVNNAPLEKSFEKITTPFEEFVKRQTSGGLVLLVVVVIAIAIANSPLADSYQHLLNIPLELSLGSLSIKHSLQHWVNEGLMVIFFLLVGLELKREMLVGELADKSKAMLPIIAAVGGMLVPALFYYVFNTSGNVAHGWAIPMATDIAFALGVLTLLGNRVPKALYSFLVAIAIVDDLGAIIVIAVFYTEKIVLTALLWVVICVLVMALLNLSGVRKMFPYFVVGTILWFVLLNSGVHATLAGVLMAFTIPSRPKYNPTHFIRRMKNLIDSFSLSYQKGGRIMNNSELRGILLMFRTTIRRVETTLQRLEHDINIPVAFIILPIFAFFNAGIAIDLSVLPTVLTHSVTIGVITGLLLGKSVGIFSATWLALKFGVAKMSDDVNIKQIVGVALLCGIGFTMAIFIGELSFPQHSEYLLMAKMGILIASVIAGVLGYVWLFKISEKK